MKQIYKKENRILLSMITGMIVISLPAMSKNFHQNRGQRYPSGLRKLLRGGKISICSEKFILLFRTYKTELENYI